MAAMASAPLLSSQHHHIFCKTKIHKIVYTSDIGLSKEPNKTNPIIIRAIPPREYDSAKHTQKINTAKPLLISNAAATDECSRIQKQTRLRTSNYPKTLTAIYADLNDMCRKGRLKEALRALDNTHFRGGIPVDANMYEILLQACAKRKALEQGKQVHAHMRLTRLDRYESLRVRLVKMYSSCGSIEDARQVFDKTTQPSLQIWNSMIRGYVRKGFCETEALEFYHQMRLAGVKADRNTFSCVLKACGGMLDLQQGKEIHEHIIEGNFQSNAIVGTALVDMYSKCGYIEDARQAFDKMSQKNVITWTVMIAGMTRNGFWDEALEYFWRMQMEGEKPNSITLASVLLACGKAGDLQLGKVIHGYIIKNEFNVYAFVENALIGMYFKCGQVAAARDIFNNMAETNVLLHGTMIHGFAQNGYADEALENFRQMNWDGVKPNPFTVANVFSACGDLAALQKGKETHACIIRSGLEFNASACSALIGMYSKCRRIEVARNVFNRMSEKDVASWTEMIAGHGMNGNGKEALKLFNQMQLAKLVPNCTTLLAVLYACSHAGLVDEGCQCFEGMSQNYGITPMVEHYICMADLLGRTGHLNEAYDLIQNMPLEPDVGVWEALMGACKIHCNIEIGESAQHLLDSESQNVKWSYLKIDASVVQSIQFASLVMQLNVVAIMIERWLRTCLGCSWIVIKNKVTYLW